MLSLVAAFTGLSPVLTLIPLFLQFIEGMDIRVATATAGYITFFISAALISAFIKYLNDRNESI